MMNVCVYLVSGSDYVAPLMVAHPVLSEARSEDDRLMYCITGRNRNPFLKGSGRKLFKTVEYRNAWGLSTRADEEDV